MSDPFRPDGDVARAIATDLLWHEELNLDDITAADVVRLANRLAYVVQQALEAP